MIDTILKHHDKTNGGEREREREREREIVCHRHVSCV